jgi:hypothetical protein
MDFRQDPDAQPYRGIRNNNPGNIEKGIAWQGAVGDDGTFIIFADDTCDHYTVRSAVRE